MASNILPRKKNWGAGEVNALVDGVSERLGVIRGKFSTSLTQSCKTKAWEEITNSVNACGSGETRTIKEIKKKWQDVQSQTKRKEVTRQKMVKGTGGGPSPDDLFNWEIKVVEMISDNLISGINGGYDSMETLAIPVTEAPVEDVYHPEMELIDPADLPDIDENLTTPISKENKNDKKCEPSPAKFSTSYNKGNIQERLIHIEEQKLDIMREDLKLKRRMTQALETLVELKTQKMEEYSVPPVIKF